MGLSPNMIGTRRPCVASGKRRPQLNSMGSSIAGLMMILLLL